MSRYRIEWDLHELGNKPASAPQHQVRPTLRGPRDRDRLAFARALATGDIPANAPAVAPEKAVRAAVRRRA